MTESSGAASNNWSSKQVWLKDVLSKSGTELMEISKAKNSAPMTSKYSTVATTLVGLKNVANKKGSKKPNGEDSPAKMVYYPATSFIVKTEQASQSEFCTPLHTTTPSTSTTSSLQQLLPIHAQQQNSIISTTPQNYNINQNNDGITLQQQLQQHQQLSPATSITISNNNGHGFYQPQEVLLTNIKTEQIAPNITLYTTTKTTPTSLSQATQQQEHSSSSITTIGNVQQNATTVAAAAAPTTTTTTVSTNGRRTTKPPNGNKPQFKCEQCGMIFGSKSAHTSHTKSHAKSGETIAMIGSTTSSTMSQMNTIEVNEAGLPIGIPKIPQIVPSTTGGTDPYKCNVCQKTFAVPARLIRHYRTHTGERPFECEFCHKLFSVKENLQVHRRIHTKERPYKCDICGRAFEHSGKLHRHMRIHTGERPHKCSVCEKTFIQSGQLVIHMRTHTGEKPYKCPVEGCGKGFTCSKQLKVHSRTHTGEKPYHCDICFRDFGYNHVLKLHRVQHYGSKCYKCTICDKTFKSKKEMEAHIKGHANEIPDDDEEVGNASVVSPQTSSVSSGAETTNSPPASPQSPTTNAVVESVPKTRKPRQPRGAKVSGVNNKSPPSPSSPSSTHSPSSSLASASRLSAGSPTSSVASPAAVAVNLSSTMPATMPIDTDIQYNSHDSGITSSYSTISANQRHFNDVLPSRSPVSYSIDELPTDLSIGQQHTQTKTTTIYYHQASQPNSRPTSPPTYTYLRQPSPSLNSVPSISEIHAINPVLLEAASIAREDEVTQAAYQIMKLNRSTLSNAHHGQQQLHHNASANHAVLNSPTAALLLNDDLAHHEDDATKEANELIAHYKRGELARHGIHRRVAPVPKFESSMLVRQVEAAIAPLRSSTESPERSSSPESDCMLVGDRDAATLPLRKRKLYMYEDIVENGGASTANISSPNPNGNGTNDGNKTNQKVMRISSVIQFAKAS